MAFRRAKILAFCAACAVNAQQAAPPADDLTNLTIEELFQIQVTSVDRKAQQLSKAPAAVFVLTADDIRRSGATSIPEALEWVPGLTVLQVDRRDWAISARGSAGLYADKMLVMIDGRSLYSPLFSGVIWDSVDVPLEDIEQIEVVRGPGAVMWGPNAVNGVINILTKSSRATKGGEISAATGNELHGSILGRWGAALNNKVSFRIWTKLDDQNPAYGSAGYYDFGAGSQFTRDPRNINDLDSESVRIGFRIDAELTAKDTFLFEGDLYKTGSHDEVAYPVTPTSIDPEVGHTAYEGGFIQARWTRTPSSSRESSLQFTYDRNDLQYPFIGGNLNNLTVNFESRQETGDRNEIYWGAGFQQYWDNTWTERYVGFNPASSKYRVGDIVGRDEFQFIPDRLQLSAGMRVDYSSYQRFEFQPSVRLLYTPSQRQSLWTAYSRAARIPSRFETSLDADAGAVQFDGYLLQVKELGSPSFRSEVENSVEAGYRLQSSQRWSFDESIFWSYYERLRALSFPSQPSVMIVDGVPVIQLLMTEANAGTGRSYGSETAATWQISPKWRLIPSYSYLNERQWLPASLSTNYEWDLRSSSAPHQGLLRSQYDLSHKWQLDLMARARSRNSSFDLPGVMLFDARIGWRPGKGSEFSFAMQNIVGRPVVEAVSEVPFVAIPLRRTFTFRWTQRF